MIGLSLKVDMRGVAQKIRDAEKQIKFAQVQALNTIGFNIQHAERATISSLFAHPRPFTVNSVFVKRATKALPVATIFIKPVTASYLSPYEDGGTHTIPNRPELGRVLLEPVHAKTDAYGQFPTGAVARMLARPDVFVVTIHGILGIWQRLPRGDRRDGAKGIKGKLTLALSGRDRTGLILLAKVVPNRPVHKHLEFVKRGEAIFLAQYPEEFVKAFDRAMATARN